MVSSSLNDANDIKHLGGSQALNVFYLLELQCTKLPHEMQAKVPHAHKMNLPAPQPCVLFAHEWT